MLIKSLTLLAAILATSASTSAFARANYVKVCSHRSEPIWVVYAKREWNQQFASLSFTKSSGWFRFEPGECRTLGNFFQGYFSLYAKNQNGDWTSEDWFNVNDMIKKDSVCVINNAFKDVLSGHCDTDGPVYWKVQGHTFDFFNTRNYNVYEIGI